MKIDRTDNEVTAERCARWASIKLYFKHDPVDVAFRRAIHYVGDLVYKYRGVS